MKKNLPKICLCYLCKFLKCNLFKRCSFTKPMYMLCLVIRKRKYLRAKFGGGDDEMHDVDDEEDEEDYKLTLGGKKFSHGAENRNFEVSTHEKKNVSICKPLICRFFWCILLFLLSNCKILV